MDKQLLAEAVAALLPEKTTHHIDTVLRLGKASRELLAFECHKALTSKYVYCSLFSDRGEFTSYDYGDHLDEDGQLIALVSGEGVTHELNIFAAVVEWFEKGGCDE